MWWGDWKLASYGREIGLALIKWVIDRAVDWVEIGLVTGRVVIGRAGF